MALRTERRTSPFGGVRHLHVHDSMGFLNTGGRRRTSLSVKFR